MSKEEGIKAALINLQEQLKTKVDAADWHHKQFQRYEVEVISLKQAIQELEELIRKSKEPSLLQLI